MIRLTSVRPASSSPLLLSPSSRLSASEKEVELNPAPDALANVCKGWYSRNRAASRGGRYSIACVR